MNQEQKIEQFIEKYCQGYQGWSKERTISATKDLKSLMDSKWISLEDEGNPKIPNWYLAKRKCKKDIGYYGWDGKEWYGKSSQGFFYFNDITHYQLRPQPPKEE